MNTAERIETITAKLNRALSPSYLEVIDDSAAHKGHAGAKTGLGHFTVIIASGNFASDNLLDRHREIYEALGDLMQTDIHALKIIIR